MTNIIRRKMHKLIERDEDEDGITWDYEDRIYLHLLHVWRDCEGLYVDGNIEFRIFKNRNFFCLVLSRFNKLNNVTYMEKLLENGGSIEIHHFHNERRTAKTTTWESKISKEELILATFEWDITGRIHFTVYNKTVNDKLLEFVRKLTSQHYLCPNILLQTYHLEIIVN